MQRDAEDDEEQGVTVSADGQDGAEGDDAAPPREWAERQATLNLGWARRRDADEKALRYYKTLLEKRDLETSKSHIAAVTIERYRLAAAQSTCCSDGCPCGHKQPPIEKRDEAGERMDLWTIHGCCTIELPVMACSNPDCGRVVDVLPVD